MEWYQLYNLLAKELAKFYMNFSNNSNFKYAGEEFFTRCQSKNNFFTLFNWAKNISEQSLDPFHVFVSFNNNGTSVDNKIKRLQFYFDILEYKIDVSKFLIDNRFSAPHIPVAKLLTNRTKETQNEIWKFFIGIVNDNIEIIRQGFDNYDKWYGINFVVITEMLFWVNSSKYISLDKNTSKLLLNKNVIQQRPYDFHTYFSLIRQKEEQKLNDNFFRVLIKYAYDNELPEDTYFKADLLKFFKNKGTEEFIPVQKNYDDYIKQNIKFQLIAIKNLNAKDNIYTKNLVKNELYQFNKNFEFLENKIIYYKKREIDLYKIDNIDININVIVGENGSGKSTLLELGFMIINNISRQLFEKQGLKDTDIQIKYISGINAELYFFTDHLYKINVQNEKIAIQKFNQIGFNDENIQYGNPSDVTKNFNFDNLYYTNHINYSLHSLNQNYFGDWIYSLFHKNDGYKTPIVLEPYRKKGEIDINLLQSLIKNRLLSYILNSSNQSFIQLTKKAKVKKIVLTVDYLKFTSLGAKVPSKFDCEQLIKKLSEIFDFNTDSILEKVIYFINNLLNPLHFDRNLYINDGNEVLLKKNFNTVPIEFFFIMYIFYKLDSIVEKYDDFFEFKNYKQNNQLIPLLQFIKKDTSHTTFKIRQAIYNLKYIDNLSYQNNKKIFKIDKLSNIIINEILAKELDKDLNLKFNDLIPSSIFKVDIILENNESFDSLSSGEKQKIFVTSSIMYHLRNIDSKSNGYSNINIVLDEIELYFHPEMQKDFINDLLFMLESNEYFQNISALNFMFITHSPFILSDIVDNHLLMLDKYAHPIKENKKTFGANIYDLLHDNFFMDGFIGKFAEKKIKQVIDIIKLYKSLLKEDDTYKKFLESYSEFFKIKTSLDNKSIIMTKIETSKHELFILVNTIGEPILRNKLLDELTSIFEKVEDNNLTNIVNNLKLQNYEKIKNELSQYSEATQKNIIKKLFGTIHD